jgi:glycosyltransferase involved in cell wall biosynthesis
MYSFIFVLPCFYSPSDPKSTGGTISNYLIAKILSRNHLVTILAPETEVSDFLNEKLNVIRVKRASLSGLKGKVLGGKVFRSALESKINSSTEKKILLFGGATNFLASYFSDREKLKIILLVRAYDDFIYGRWSPVTFDRFHPFLKKNIDRGRTKRAFNNADAIITNSEWMVSCVKKSFPSANNVCKLYPPLDLSDLKSGFALREKCDFTVGFVSRGSGKAKGIDLIFKLAKEQPDITFNIYGGLDQREVNKKISKNINIKGWTSRGIMFSENHLFLVPSVWPEPFGRIAIETQVSGLPVLVSGSGGLPETVISNDCIVIDEGDWPHALVQARQNYKSLKSKVSKANGELIIKFSLKTCEDELLKILRLI